MRVTPVLDRKGSPVLVENPDGGVVPAYVFNAAGATRAIELLGKHIGVPTDKLKLEGDLQVTGQVNVYLPGNGRDKRD